MSKYARILAAVDFSAATEVVCRRAADLAGRYKAELGLVHVVEPVIVDPVYDMVPIIPVEFEMEQVEKSRKELYRLADRYGISRDRCWVDSGATKYEILRRAEREKIDLIVLGSHGRHGVSLLLGSTANAILHGADCDVLAVRIAA